MTAHRLSVSLLGVLVTGAATISAFQQQAPDRSQPPAVGPAPALHVPAIDKRTLANGLQVWLVPSHKVTPLASITT